MGKFIHFETNKTNTYISDHPNINIWLGLKRLVSSIGIACANSSCSGLLVHSNTENETFVYDETYMTRGISAVSNKNCFFAEGIPHRKLWDICEILFLPSSKLALGELKMHSAFHSQVITGISFVNSFVPIVLGHRMSIRGAVWTKTGTSSMILEKRFGNR